MKIGTLAALATLLLAGSPALAEEIGRVELDGRSVILNEDKSWEYASQDEALAPEGCKEISSAVVPVALCLSEDKWILANLDGAEEHGFRLKDRELYLLLITETEVIDIPTLKKAALVNAQKAAKLNKVNTLEETSASIDGHEFGKIVYQTIVDDIDITYANYHSSFEGAGSVQIVMFAATGEFESFAPEMAEVIAGAYLTN